VNDLTCV